MGRREGRGEEKRQPETVKQPKFLHLIIPRALYYLKYLPLYGTTRDTCSARFFRPVLTPLVAHCDVLSKIGKKNASTFCCYLILISIKLP